jgi:metal-dependent hydrolase (beta-lactamase superfamily II)
MLLDSSSGTVLQKQLGTTDIRLRAVRHLFVSHPHFDHAGGEQALLIAMAALPENSMTVHATPETLQALKELLELTIPGVEDWLGGRLRWDELQSTWVRDAEVIPF